MNEIRQDYLLDRFVIIAENRAKRPKDFVIQKVEEKKRAACVFCPGNEHLTPPETGRVGGKGRKWLVRSFYNDYPAVAEWFPLARGSHEVIAETPDHEKQFGDLSAAQIGRVVQMYAERTAKLERDPHVKYVSIFKNQMPAAGTSIAHAHSQLMALDRVPPLVNEEVAAFGKKKRSSGDCVFCSVAEEEEESERQIASDPNFIALAPYASRVPFEVWLIPKRHVRKVTNLREGEVSSLARMLRLVLSRLDGLFGRTPLNFYLHAAPDKQDFHFHVEIVPRLNIWAGFELGSGAYINPVAPEAAAEALRDCAP